MCPIKAAVNVLLAVLAATYAPQAARPLPAAEGIVARVLQARATSGFLIRAKLTRVAAGSNREVTSLLAIKGRQDGTRSTVLYQVIGPKDQAGHALLLDDRGDHRLSGFRFDAGTITPLTPAAFGDSFLGSDLRIEDVTEGFWHWRSARTVGEEAVGSRRCLVLEFRPEPGAPTGYSRVKAWIAGDIALPLRVETFATDGRLERRMTAGRVVKRGERWGAATLTFEPPGAGSRTIIEGSKWEQDLSLPASEFSPEAIRASWPGGH